MKIRRPPTEAPYPSGPCKNALDEICKLVKNINGKITTTRQSTTAKINDLHDHLYQSLPQANDTKMNDVQRRSANFIRNIADYAYEALTPWSAIKLHKSEELPNQLTSYAEDETNSNLLILSAMESMQTQNDHNLKNLSSAINSIIDIQTMINKEIDAELTSEITIGDSLKAYTTATLTHGDTVRIVENIREAVDDLAENRISTSLLPDDRLQEILDLINTKIGPNYITTSQNLNEARSETITRALSHRTANSTTLIIEMIFDIMEITEKYQLYETIAHPVRIEGTNLTTTVILQSTYHAIQEPGKYILYLNTRPSGSIANNYIKHTAENQCIYNIAHQNTNNIKNTCKFKIEHMSEEADNMITKLSDRTYLISHDTEINLSCSNESVIFPPCSQCIYDFKAECKGNLTDGVILDHYITTGDNQNTEINHKTTNIALLSHFHGEITGSSIENRNHTPISEIVKELKLHKLNPDGKLVPIDSIAEILRDQKLPNFKIGPKEHGYMLLIINGVILLIFSLFLCRINRKITYIGHLPVSTAEILINDQLTKDIENNCAGVHVIYIAIFIIIVIALAITHLKSKKKTNQIVLFMNSNDRKYSARQVISTFSVNFDCRNPTITQHKSSSEVSRNRCNRKIKVILTPENTNTILFKLTMCNRQIEIPQEIQLTAKNLWKLRKVDTEHLEIQIALITHENLVYIPTFEIHPPSPNRHQYATNPHYRNSYPSL